MGRYFKYEKGLCEAISVFTDESQEAVVWTLSRPANVNFRPKDSQESLSDSLALQSISQIRYENIKMHHF